MPRGSWCVDPTMALLSRVRIDRETDCWNWTGPRFKSSGYGQIIATMLHPTPITTHRASWLIHNGPIPKEGGIELRHRCDNRVCVNPAHLLLGTRKQNVGDCIYRARLCRGSAHPNAKLDIDKVIELRRLRGEGWSYPRLAVRYDVHPLTILKAARRQTWKHVL